jgi:hypothetical protein
MRIKAAPGRVGGPPVLARQVGVFPVVVTDVTITAPVASFSVAAGAAAVQEDMVSVTAVATWAAPAAAASLTVASVAAVFTLAAPTDAAQVVVSAASPVFTFAAGSATARLDMAAVAPVYTFNAPLPSFGSAVLINAPTASMTFAAPADAALLGVAAVSPTATWSAPAHKTNTQVIIVKPSITFAAPAAAARLDVAAPAAGLSWASAAAAAAVSVQSVPGVVSWIAPVPAVSTGGATVAGPVRTDRTRSEGPHARTSSVGLPRRTASSGARGRARVSDTVSRTRAARFSVARTRVCTLGYSNQTSPTDIPTLEAAIGRKFHGLRQNQQITTTSWAFAISDYDAGRGPITYRSIQISSGHYTDITSGSLDANLTTIGNGLLAAARWTPGHAILTFQHETTLSSNDVFGTAQDYIDAFRHFRVLMDTLGITKYDRFGVYRGGPALIARTAFEREFTNGTVNTPPAGKSFDDFDPNLGTVPTTPGIDYWELLGVDPYNDIVSGSLRYGTDAATLLDGPRNAALARGKNWFIGEIGCMDGSTAQSHLDKAAWLDSVRTYITGLGARGPGVCKHMFTTQETGSLYNWDSSPEALAAGKRIADSTYFA